MLNDRNNYPKSGMTLTEAFNTFIQQSLNVDNVTLAKALYGASGSVCQKFLCNISDKLLPYIDEDIKNCKTDKKEITNAQEEILRLAKRYD